MASGLVKFVLVKLVDVYFVVSPACEAGMPLKNAR